MDRNLTDFGAEDQTQKTFRRPGVVAAHLGFRIAALFVYVFGMLWTDSFIVAFLTILFFLSLDFWVVKNITGRLLVGLRWWNFVDQEGNNHWRYESRRDQSVINANEARVFWLALVVSPLVWCLLIFSAFFTFRMTWLIVTVMGVAMNGANLYGYLRCKWSSRKEFSTFVSTTMLRSFVSRATADAQASDENRRNMAADI